MLFALALIANSGPNLLQKADHVLKMDSTLSEFQLSVSRYLWDSPESILVSDRENAAFEINVENGQKKSLGCTLPQAFTFLASDKARTRFIDEEWRGKTMKRTLETRGEGRKLFVWTSPTQKEDPGMDSIDMSLIRPSTFWDDNSNQIYDVDGWMEGAKTNIRISAREISFIGFPKAEPLAHPRELVWILAITLGRVIAITAYQNLGRDNHIYEWQVDRPETTMHELHIRPPQGPTAISCTPSPRGDKLLWELGRKDDRRSRAAPQPVFDAFELWISDFDGKSMKPLGAIPLSGSNDSRIMAYQEFGGIQWNPTEKSVSFIFRRNFYVVPVDQPFGTSVNPIE